MKQKFTLTIISLLLSITFFGQEVKIGQSAYEILSMIKMGASYRSNSTWDVSYKNGQIEDAILCQDNEYMIDIGVYTDYCKHFLMKNERLTHILTQYQNLSVNQLKKYYNQLHDKIKIEDKYYDSDYKNYSIIYLNSNGLATIEWTKTNVNLLPQNIRDKIDNEIKRQREEENNRILAQQEEGQRKKEITSKVYDLKYDFPEDYKTFIETQQNKIIQYFRDCTQGRYSLGLIPETFEIENSKEKFINFESIYNVEYFDNNSGYTERNVTLVSGTDKQLTLIKSAYQRLPEIDVKGYRIKKTLNIPEFSVKYTLGFTKVKVKDGIVEFISNPPIDKFKTEIIDNLKSKNNGKYYIIYEITDVLNTLTVNTKIIDKDNRYDVMKMNFKW